MFSRSKFAVLAVCLLLIPAASLAAEGDMLAEQTHGSGAADFGYDMQPTADGGLIMAGRTYGFGSSGSDAYLVRLDADDNEVWATTVGTIADDGCNAITETSDGGFLLVGWVDINSFLRKGQAIKVDSSGQVVWQKFYLGDDSTSAIFVEDQFEAVLETADGDFVMAGTANSYGIRQPWLVRVDADGNVVWEAHHVLQGHGKDYLTGLVETPGGDFAGSGRSGDSNTFTDFDPNAFAFSSSGAFLWQRTLPGSSPADVAYGIGIGPDGNLAVVGQGSIPTLWLLSTAGTVESTTPFGPGGRLFTATATTDGGLLLAGAERQADLTNQAWIIKTDADGDFQWDNRFGGSNEEVFFAAHERANGEYALFGWTDSYGAGDNDYYLVLAEGSDAVTGVADAGIPQTSARLDATLSAYPNPFNPKTTIAFELPVAAPTTVDVVGVQGRHVRTLVNGEFMDAGPQLLHWDGREDSGRSAATGVYFVNVRSGEAHAHQKIVLVK